MFEISFINIELLYTIIYLLIRIICWCKNKRIDFKRELILLLMYINLFVIIRFTLFPFKIVEGKIQTLTFDINNIFPLRINLKPFIRLKDYVNKSDMWFNTLGNIAMFIPTGIILPIIYKKLDKSWKVILVGMFISLDIEIIQLLFRARSSDIDDFIFNTLGVLIGYLIYYLSKKIIKYRQTIN